MIAAMQQSCRRRCRARCRKIRDSYPQSRNALSRRLHRRDCHESRGHRRAQWRASYSATAPRRGRRAGRRRPDRDPLRGAGSGGRRRRQAGAGRAGETREEPARPVGRNRRQRGRRAVSEGPRRLPPQIPRPLLRRAEPGCVHAPPAAAGRHPVVAPGNGARRYRRALRRRHPRHHDPRQSADPRDRRRLSDRGLDRDRRIGPHLARFRRRQHPQPDRQPLGRHRPTRAL